jgi:hypothetical protein
MYETLFVQGYLVLYPIAIILLVWSYVASLIGAHYSRITIRILTQSVTEKERQLALRASSTIVESRDQVRLVGHLDGHSRTLDELQLHRLLDTDIWMVLEADGETIVLGADGRFLFSRNQALLHASLLLGRAHHSGMVRPYRWVFAGDSPDATHTPTILMLHFHEDATANPRATMSVLPLPSGAFRVTAGAFTVLKPETAEVSADWLLNCLRSNVAILLATPEAAPASTDPANCS